jgi:hypothetical protein
MDAQAAPCGAERGGEADDDHERGDAGQQDCGAPAQRVAA